MVDELELLKKDWQKQSASLPTLSKEEIYPMLLKRSSSIVKWILIISIIEFAFWITVNYLGNQIDSNAKFIAGTNSQTAETTLLVINYIALTYFIIRFYLNYKAIRTTDNSRKLMSRILRARSTVKQYIWFNVILFFLGTLIIFGLAYTENPEVFQMTNPFLLIVVLLVVILVFIAILLLIYRLLYGRLLKRLQVNYEQLKKLEV